MLTEADAKTKWPVLGQKNGHSKGYVRLRCPSHPNADGEGYVYEHIYVASRALGRGLKKGETVHHVYGQRSNNRNNNLLICTHAYHRQLHERLGQSPDWPQFKPRCSSRPRCAECRKKIAYDVATGLCREHYEALVKARIAASVCRVPECTERAGSRSGICRPHRKLRDNKRRYAPKWNFPHAH